MVPNVNLNVSIVPSIVEVLSVSCSSFHSSKCKKLNICPKMSVGCCFGIDLYLCNGYMLLSVMVRGLHNIFFFYSQSAPVAAEQTPGEPAFLFFFFFNRFVHFLWVAGSDAAAPTDDSRLNCFLHHRLVLHMQHLGANDKRFLKVKTLLSFCELAQCCTASLAWCPREHPGICSLPSPSSLFPGCKWC